MWKAIAAVAAVLILLNVFSPDDPEIRFGRVSDILQCSKAGAHAYVLQLETLSDKKAPRRFLLTPEMYPNAQDAFVNARSVKIAYLDKATVQCSSSPDEVIYALKQLEVLK